ncbi:MAG: LacI family DNA-binding transcriptional regulator [Planctomycetota bacterium]
MATLDQIAESVGVSRKTVARALNGQHEAKYAPTAKRFKEIRKVADRLGYRPNASAKATRTGKFNAIGYLHSSKLSNSHTNSALMRGVYSVLRDRDLLLTSAMHGDEHLTDEGVVPKLLRELSADGLLIDYLTRVPEGMPEMIRHFRIPSIWVNVKHDIDCVRPDDIAAGRIATEHLIERGHRRILCGSLAITSHYSHKDRLEGYRLAMQDAGLEPVVFDPKLVRYGDRLSEAMQWFAQNDKPDAIMTPGPGSSTPMAAAALANGHTLGEDIACITVSNMMDRSFGVDMTTVIIPFEEVGQLAVKELLLKIDAPDEERPGVAVRPTLDVGNTT